MSYKEGLYGEEIVWGRSFKDPLSASLQNDSIESLE